MLCRMTVIALTSADLRSAREYVQVVDSLGAEVRLLLPAEQGGVATEQVMNDVGGLLLPGGLDVDPSRYGATPNLGAGPVLGGNPSGRAAGTTTSPAINAAITSAPAVKTAARGMSSSLRM